VHLEGSLIKLAFFLLGLSVRRSGVALSDGHSFANPPFVLFFFGGGRDPNGLLFPMSFPMGPFSFDRRRGRQIPSGGSPF